MFSLFEISTFIGATVLLLVIPGPAVIYVMARSLEQGPIAGLASAAGTALGGLVHVLAAVVGLSALIMTSTLAFSVVKYLGAAYLIFLGLSKIFETAELSAPQHLPRRNLTRLFWDGVVIETFNPKVAAFFLSFLPQFIHPERGSVSAQILILGLIFCILALISDSLFALIAHFAGSRILRRTSTQSRKNLNRVTGWIYITLGALSLALGPKGPDAKRALSN